MEYREIVSVTGLGGLFQLVGSKKDGAIVRSLADKSTRFISARLHNVTPLETIEIYTTGDNVRLHEVLQQMKDSDIPRPDTKAGNNDIKAYFKSVYPQMDEDRVYVSDMKKILKWYNLLHQNDLLHFEMYQPAEAEIAEEPVAVKSADEAAADTSEEKPKKTARKKKTADEPEDSDAPAEKPAKKTASKKKTEE